MRIKGIIEWPAEAKHLLLTIHIVEPHYIPHMYFYTAQETMIIILPEKNSELHVIPQGYFYTASETKIILLCEKVYLLFS